MLPRAVTRVGLLATFDSPSDGLSYDARWRIRDVLVIEGGCKLHGGLALQCVMETRSNTTGYGSWTREDSTLHAEPHSKPSLSLLVTIAAMLMGCVSTFESLVSR